MARNIWSQEIYHQGLNKYKIIKGATKREVEIKSNIQMAAWDELWEKRLEKERMIIEKENALFEQQEKIDYAEEETATAENIQQAISNILKGDLDENADFDWSYLKSFEQFPEPRPILKPFLEFPTEPKRSDEPFNPKQGLLNKLLKNKAQEQKKHFDKLFSEVHSYWVKNCEGIEIDNKLIDKENQESIKNWERERNLYEERQKDYNLGIDNNIAGLTRGESEPVAEFIKTVLTISSYPFEFEKSIDCSYDYGAKSVIIDYLLPNKEELPSLKKLNYVKSRDSFKKMVHSEAYMNKIYDVAIYQIVLKSMHEIFSSTEKYDLVENIVFNGIIDSIDTATGKNITPCILSVSVAQEQFAGIELANVDPKECFKKLRGIAAVKLSSITPVAPIAQLDMTDKRFVDGYDVIGGIDDEVNLASMDWQDFENLIREIFESEFNSSGGEVKITQASRDGGVDAVAFDPDPIRGGKIVIQAKRYTNVVGVSAVRDLYGTVLNEGATKGILVTTSNYGNDAYNFASDKPLTLLNGGNLLSLLEKHGHKAKIDIAQAKLDKNRVSLS
ncbi:restriction endonuclease [Listeria newyorkensis]|uniref:Restriction endonuclease n=1 Tax=Listeria newyorkensis TaxID=1497681 RepID=A0A841YU68_9LIST|nr:restriction endonuclease [Listeria newyorkensis]MBC1456166.1 restriction endonuclease [Listeria newyorkensis]